MSDDAPRSAADPRPGGEPYYIDTECPECGLALVLHDETVGVRDPDAIWHDEWVCPECEDGIHLDWPEDALEGLRRRARSSQPFTPLEDLEE